jgi:hypothetical protein
MFTRSDERGGRGVRSRSVSPSGGRTVVSNPKCPVCAWEIKDKGQEVKVEDRTVVVCCEDCAKEVKKNPAKYVGAK